MTQKAIVSEIREILAAIELDLDPFVRADSMRYTGYLSENAADLQLLVAALLNQGKA